VFRYNAFEQGLLNMILRNAGGQVRVDFLWLIAVANMQDLFAVACLDIGFPVKRAGA